MQKSLPIYKLITIGFGLIVIVFALNGSISLYEVNHLQKKSQKISHIRVPTVYNSASMKNSINKALAALHGWLLLKEDHFDTKLKESWVNIRSSETQMAQLSEYWKAPVTKQQFKQLQLLLNDFEKIQFKIFEISNEEYNLPANQLLSEEIVPLMLQMTDAITALVDLEEPKKINQKHKQLLTTLVHFRNTLGKSLVYLRSFIITEQTHFIQHFEESWVKNQQYFNDLMVMKTLFSDKQLRIMNQLNENRERFSALSDITIKIKQSKDWNKANYLLKSEAIPISEQLTGILNQIILDQRNQLQQDNILLEQSIDEYKQELLLLCITAILFTLWLGWMISRRSSAAQKLIDHRAALIDQNIMLAHLDSDGHVKDISNSLCRALEGIKADFIGQQSYFFLPDADNSPLHSTITKIIQTDKTWEGEFCRRNQNNEVIWFHSILIPSLKGGPEGKGYTNILQDITDQKRLEELSITDKLTGLFNRRHFDNIFEQQLKLAQRMEVSITLCIIDVDHFKDYNDHYGHQAGDHALVQVAHVLKNTLKRPDDFVFRLGGEEFGIIFNNMDTEHVHEVLKKLQNSILALRIKHEKSEVHEFLTTSIGCKVCTAARNIQTDMLYLAADTALYDAKKTRNSIVIV